MRTEREVVENLDRDGRLTVMGHHDFADRYVNVILPSIENELKKSCQGEVKNMVKMRNFEVLSGKEDEKDTCGYVLILLRRNIYEMSRLYWVSENLDPANQLQDETIRQMESDQFVDKMFFDYYMPHFPDYIRKESAECLSKKLEDLQKEIYKQTKTMEKYLEGLDYVPKKQAQNQLFQQSKRLREHGESRKCVTTKSNYR